MTGWFKIVQYNDKQSAAISNLVEQVSRAERQNI